MSITGIDMNTLQSRAVSLVAIAAISGCAGMDAAVNPPAVSLESVEMTDVDFDRQTCLLGFVVSNPNPFPLPVESVRYRIALGDQQFAGGETQGSFTVPPDGAVEFVISTELNLLRSTSYISTLIRTGMRRQMDYELSGSFSVDIPFANTLEFSNSGRIELQAAGL